MVAVWAAAMWLPWVPFSKSYTYYAAPIVPALAVAVVLACRDLLPSRVRPVVLPAGLLAALVVFADSHAALPWEL